MAGLKEIKRRLRSVNNTKKITYAMKLVSAAKLKRAQDAVTSFRRYRNELDRSLGHIQEEAGEEVLHDPLMAVREDVKNICLIVVGGQRGLCGGYNTSLHKQIEAVTREMQMFNPLATFHYIILGRKVADYFKRIKRTAEKSIEDLQENVILWPIEALSREVQAGFLSRKYDEVWLVYTRFKSVISQQPTSEKLLPLEVAGPVSKEGFISEAKIARLTVFEPSPRKLFAAILPRIVNARLRQACLDAKASETGSRMTAMDAATRNASQLVRKLELKHNKIRQNRITSELLDIMGGAEAIK